MDLRNLVYRAISGEKNADVSGKGTDILAQLRAIGGRSPHSTTALPRDPSTCREGEFFENR